MSFGSKAPSKGDYKRAAQQDYETSVKSTDAQTLANRANQTNAYGDTLNWTRNPDGSWSQSTSLGGTRQASMDAQQQTQLGRQQAAQGLGGAVNDALSRPFQTYDGQEGADAFYNQGAKRLDQQYGTKHNQLNAYLAAQGLDPGSEAYKNAQTDLNTQENDAYNSLINSATQYGVDYATKQQALDQASRSEAMDLQDQALNGQTIGTPEFADYYQAGNAGGTNMVGALNGATQAAQANNLLLSSAIGGASQVGAAMAFSDARLKKNIHRYPQEALPGVRWASWEWAWGGRGFGVIAQDLEKVRPDLVGECQGYKTVNYGRLP